MKKTKQQCVTTRTFVFCQRVLLFLPVDYSSGQTLVSFFFCIFARSIFITSSISAHVRMYRFNSSPFCFWFPILDLSVSFLCSALFLHTYAAEFVTIIQSTFSSNMVRKGLADMIPETKRVIATVGVFVRPSFLFTNILNRGHKMSKRREIKFLQVN
jgi:hypothetical protein